jgi:hypothetical protein
MFLDKLSLRAKVLGVAGVLLVFLAATGVMALRSLGAVEARGGTMYNDRVVPLRDIGRSGRCSATSTA